MNDISPELKAVISKLSENFEVTDEEYQNWKVWYETLPEHEKVFRLLGAVSQYLVSPCNASASVLASAIVCSERWCNEKDDEDF